MGALWDFLKDWQYTDMGVLTLPRYRLVGFCKTAEIGKLASGVYKGNVGGMAAFWLLLLS
jgi:hypothetical protein